MCGLSFLLQSHSSKAPDPFPHTCFVWLSLHSYYVDSLWPFHWAHFHSQILSLSTLPILCHKISGLWSSSESTVARQAEGTRQKTRSQSLLGAQSWERPTRSPGPPKSRSAARLQSLPERAAQHAVMAASSCVSALSRQL